MKILFITYTIKEEFGVGSARSRMLYNMLLEKKHKIDLISDNRYTIINIIKYIVFGNYDRIYFSGPPFSKYIVAIMFAIMCSVNKINIIVDFRDPWSIHVKNKYGKSKKNYYIKYYISSLIEKYIYSKCMYFVVCTDGMYNIYAQMFKDASKIRIVYNGHDLSIMDIQKMYCKNFPSNNIKKIICCGKFASYSLEGAKRFFGKLKEINQSFEVVFVGTDILTIELLKKFSCNNIKFLVINRCSYKECFEKIIQSDIGILLLRDEDFEYGTKVFDYIAAGKPIFNLFDHQKNFYQRFKKFIFDDFNNIPKIQPDIHMDYSRKKQLQKLLGLIESKEVI